MGWRCNEIAAVRKLKRNKKRTTITTSREQATREHSNKYSNLAHRYHHEVLTTSAETMGPHFHTLRAMTLEALIVGNCHMAAQAANKGAVCESDHRFKLAVRNAVRTPNQCPVHFHDSFRGISHVPPEDNAANDGPTGSAAASGFSSPGDTNSLPSSVLASYIPGVLRNRIRPQPGCAAWRQLRGLEVSMRTDTF